MAGVGLFALALLAVWLPTQAGDPQRVIAAWGEAKVGQERAELVGADLRVCTAHDLPSLQKAAYSIFMEDMRAFRGRSGEVVASAMHLRASATWSMICLSGSQLRTGQLELAMGTVHAHLRQIEGNAPMEEVRAVWDRLALVARGTGLREEMLDALGHSLAMGSEDALQLLGWDEFVLGEWSRSTRLFSTLLDRAEAEGRDPAPWALPGWGLSLLEDMGR